MPSCAGSRAPTHSRARSGTLRLPPCRSEALEKNVTLAAFSSFVRPEYIAPRVGCRVTQGAYQFLDLGAACVRPA